MQTATGTMSRRTACKSSSILTQTVPKTRGFWGADAKMVANSDEPLPRVSHSHE